MWWAGRGNFPGLRIHSRKKPTWIPGSYCGPVKTYPWAAVIFRVKKIWFLNNPRMKNRAWEVPLMMLSCLSLQETGILMSRSLSEPPPGPAARRHDRRWPSFCCTDRPTLEEPCLVLSQKVAPNHLVCHTFCFVSWTVWDSTCKLIMQPKGKI